MVIPFELKNVLELWNISEKWHDTEVPEKDWDKFRAKLFLQITQDKIFDTT